MCDCLAIVARIVIGFLSLIFTILGLAFFAIGIMLRVQSEQLNALFSSVSSQLTSQAEGALGGTAELPVSDITNFLKDLVGGLGIAFIVLGIVMALVGIMGMGGACCMVKVMIIIYMCFVGALTIALLILVIILAVNPGIVIDKPREEMKATLQTEFRGLNGTDITSLLWNVVMNFQQCCGVDGAVDFEKATAWRQSIGPESTLQYETPVACCKSGQYSPPNDIACVTAGQVTATNNNKDIGCYNKLLDLVIKGTFFIGFSAGSISFLALMTFFSAVILFKILRKNKVGSSF